jgi:predicted dehydrogenase
MIDPTNRRNFLRASGAFALGLGALGAQKAPEKAPDPPAKAPGVNAPREPEPVPEEPKKPVKSKDALVVGVMGTNGRGTELATEFATQPGSVVRYVCDVDANNAGRCARAVTERQDLEPTVVADFRRILDDKSVDALVIAAPDHWHAIAAILACKAGKHVYVEKPCCHNPREGELLVQAARKYKRTVQQGTQRRSWPKNVEGVELVRSGGIGRVLFSRGWYNNKRPGIGRGKPVPVPPRLDWALWQGPAPEKEFRDNYVHYNWHWFWNWGTGELGNNGVHGLDVCLWGLGVDYPRRVTAGGGRYYYDDDQQTPDTLGVTYDFGDKGMIVWEGRSCNPHGFEGSGFGAAFYGDEGTVVIDGGGYRVFDEKGKQAKEVGGGGANAGHVTNFLECARSGERPAADIEIGYRSALVCHLGNIAWRTGRTVNLDPDTHRIAGDREQQTLWGREYRKGWEPTV